MDQSFSSIITTREEACSLIERYFERLDEAVFAPMVRGMTTSDDEGVFAIMRGSDNDMALFDKALYLLRRHGFLSHEEAMDIITRKQRARAAQAA